MCVLHGLSQVSKSEPKFEVNEVDNSMFTSDKFWRGADGAASIDLENGKILWLFSDTFIDPKGSSKRRNAKMINNSIAIQEGNDLDQGKMSFYYKGKKRKPEAYFDLPGKNWFWTGHGTLVKDKLIVLLFEEKNTNTGIGFEAIAWYIAIIDNPLDDPRDWTIKYIKGSDTFGVILGSSAVLKDKDFMYAYGVTEPSSHEVYLLRFPIDEIIEGDISGLEWWNEQQWMKRVERSPIPSPLFFGQTEFSVHYQENLNQYIQIQTYGFGAASIGYRLADQPEGPWSEPVIFYKPQLESKEDFVYSANAHPEISNGDILVTYNVNTGNFKELITNERIYFPKIIRLKISK